MKNLVLQGKFTKVKMKVTFKYGGLLKTRTVKEPRKKSELLRVWTFEK